MSNLKRMDAIVQASAARASSQRFRVGQYVMRHDGSKGVVEAVYFDLDAAINAFIIGEVWYAQLERRPKTPPGGRWYAVILENGEVLDGEDDLRELPS